MVAAFDLTGRVALVTGAGSPHGIGFCIARLLAECGASVVITSTTNRIEHRVAELRSAGFAVAGIAADLTNAQDVEKVIERVRDEFGLLDIVVNNAGMTSVSKPGVTGAIEGISVAEFDETMNRNATTAFAVIRQAMPLLRLSDQGRIINITSVTGPVMAMANEVAYAAGKAAMVGMTRALAVDLAEQGITVNAIAPGWIDTASSSEHERGQGLVTPMKRSGAAEEVAGAVAWLASPSAGYTTGQVIVIDGGNSIAEERG